MFSFIIEKYINNIINENFFEIFDFRKISKEINLNNIKPNLNTFFGWRNNYVGSSFKNSNAYNINNRSVLSSRLNSQKSNLKYKLNEANNQNTNNYHHPNNKSLNYQIRDNKLIQVINEYTGNTIKKFNSDDIINHSNVEVTPINDIHAILKEKILYDKSDNKTKEGVENQKEKQINAAINFPIENSRNINSQYFFEHDYEIKQNSGDFSKIENNSDQNNQQVSEKKIKKNYLHVNIENAYQKKFNVNQKNYSQTISNNLLNIDKEKILDKYPISQNGSSCFINLMNKNNQNNMNINSSSINNQNAENNKVNNLNIDCKNNTGTFQPETKKSINIRDKRKLFLETGKGFLMFLAKQIKCDKYYKQSLVAKIRDILLDEINLYILHIEVGKIKQFLLREIKKQTDYNNISDIYNNFEIRNLLNDYIIFY